MRLVFVGTDSLLLTARQLINGNCNWPIIGWTKWDIRYVTLKKIAYIRIELETFYNSLTSVKKTRTDRWTFWTEYWLHIALVLINWSVHA